MITLTLAEPMTAAVLSSIVLDEQIDAVGWVGIGLVLAALAVTAGAVSRARSPPPAAAASRPTS